MSAISRLDDRFLDRRGCGDELYLDSRLKAHEWLADLAGTAGHELDLPFDADADDAANH